MLFFKPGKRSLWWFFLKIWISITTETAQRASDVTEKQDSSPLCINLNVNISPQVEITVIEMFATV